MYFSVCENDQEINKSRPLALCQAIDRNSPPKVQEKSTLTLAVIVTL